MGDVILETERLVFRPFTTDDFSLLAELHSDPQVQRYIGGMWTPEEVQRRLDYYMSQQGELGWSKWKAYLKADGSFVGRAGVSVDLHTGEPELGYSFARRAWGHGLASETARAIVAWMWANTALDAITAFAVVDNLASRRALEKVGMTFVGEDWRHEDRCAYYRIGRPD